MSHSWSFVVIRVKKKLLYVPFVVIHDHSCEEKYYKSHSWSFVIIRVKKKILYVPFVVIHDHSCEEKIIICPIRGHS